jgi:hypothetical protein
MMIIGCDFHPGFYCLDLLKPLRGFRQIGNPNIEARVLT